VFVELPDWIVNLLILLLGSGIPVVYNWFTNRFIPDRLAQKKEAELRKYKTQEDDREFHQQSESGAFQQVLALNEKLIDNQINLSNGRFDRLAQRTDEGFKEIVRTIAEGDKAQAEQLGKLTEALNRINSLLTELKGQMGVVSRDWSRWSEIVADIDQEMNTIKELIKALLVKVGIKPEPGG
jgi:type I restriction-modification system DNA methylase subunit